MTPHTSLRRAAAGLARRLAGLAVVVLAAVQLGGCESERLTEVRAPKQLSVRTVDFFHSVRFPADSTILSREEQRRLRSFLAHVNAAPPDDVALAPWPPEPAGAPLSRTTEARSRAVAAVLRSAGFDPLAVSPGLQTGDRGGPRIDVAVRRYLVVLPECPDWSDRPGWNFHNQPSSNYGCANTVNFGMMIANPKDLVRGRGPAAAWAEPLADSITRYRQDEIKELQVEATTEVFEATGQDE